MNYYPLGICSLTRNLPLISVGRKTAIASFSLLGDVELVDRLADEFAARLKTYQFDYLVAPELKVIPLVHGVAKRLGQKRFVVCRKSVKPYMISPVIVKPLDHFPKHIKPLVISGPDAELLKNKKVVVLDDVVSTGVTMRMMKFLMDKIGAEIVLSAVVIKQGEQFDDLPDLLSLSSLPIFKGEIDKKNSSL